MFFIHTLLRLIDLMKAVPFEYFGIEMGDYEILSSLPKMLDFYGES